MKISDLDLNKSYTYADYYKWDFVERTELINGKVFRFLPFSPNTNHQIISGYIVLAIGNYIDLKQINVFSAPFDVRFTKKTKNDEEIITVLQPDICVICDLKKLDQKGCLGSPDIVVEILSPGNNKKELDIKFHVYEEALVKEYWIIHPDENTFFRYILNNENKFISERLLTSGSFIKTDILPRFELGLEEMFNQKIED